MGSTGGGALGIRHAFWLIAGFAILVAGWRWDIFGWGRDLMHQWEDAPRSGQRWTKETFPKGDDAFTHLLDPEVTKKGVEATIEPINWSKPHVAVYSVPAVTIPRWRPTVRDLADSGQAHAIDLLVKDPKKESAVWSALQASMMDPKEFSAEDKDPLQFERVLVATVTKGTDWRPGDRMQWTRVFVEPINFSFAGYTVASTDSDTVKVQSVENTNTRKVSANIGLTIPGLEGTKADLTPSSERTVKTTSDVNVQYERLGVDIMPAFLRIFRESEAGDDVVGNTLVNLSVTTDPLMIRTTDPRKREPDDSLVTVQNTLCQLFSIQCNKDDGVVLLVTSSVLEDGALGLEETKASISVSPQRPVPHCPLMARVWMLYEERRIDKGWEFYEESKQEISLLRKADLPRDVEVVSADDVSPAVWSIQIVPPPGAPADNKVLLLGARADNSSSYRELVFTDFRQASAVARWERTHPDQTISHLEFNYSKEGGSLVPIRKKGSDCPQSSAMREVYQPDKTATAPQRNSSFPTRPSAGLARSSVPTLHQRVHEGAKFGLTAKLGAWRSRNHAIQTATYQ